MRPLLLLVAFCIHTAIAAEPPLPPDAAKLYEQSRKDARFFAAAEKLKPEVRATSDGRSFSFVWKSTPSPKRWIASLHGAGFPQKGFAADDLAHWHRHLQDRNVGIICLQWWMGTGDTTRDFFNPEQINGEFDRVLTSVGAKPGTVMLRGFSRGMGISNQLTEINDAFETIAKHPEFNGTPIVIGESDPDGCAACTGPDRAYRNGTLYSSYTAAIFPRKLGLAAKHGVNLEGALTWSFEFEGQPYFAGFRSLATNGIDKPVLNVFRMFSRMDGQRLPVQSDGGVPIGELLKTGVREKPDVSALAARNGKRITILVWHYHDDDVPGTDATITLDITGAPEGNPKLTRTLIDQTHSNAFTAWQALGSPQAPTAEQIRDLKKAGQLARASGKSEVATADGRSKITFTLARQGVTLVELDWH